MLAVSQAREKGLVGIEGDVQGGRGKIWTAPRRRLQARCKRCGQCWANQRRTNAPELSRATVSSDMHNARPVSSPFMLLSLCPVSKKLHRQRGTHRVACAPQLASAQPGLGVLKFQQLGNISHAFLIANNEANGRSRRRQKARGRRGRKRREFEERGGGKWSRQEMQQADCSTQPDARAEAAARQAALFLLLYPVTRQKRYVRLKRVRYIKVATVERNSVCQLLQIEDSQAK